MFGMVVFPADLAQFWRYH